MVPIVFGDTEKDVISGLSWAPMGRTSDGRDVYQLSIVNGLATDKMELGTHFGIAGRTSDNDFSARLFARGGEAESDYFSLVDAGDLDAVVSHFASTVVDGDAGERIGYGRTFEMAVSDMLDQYGKPTYGFITTFDDRNLSPIGGNEPFRPTNSVDFSPSVD